MSSTDTDEVECPECGMSVGKQGLGSHKGSARCDVRQNINEIQERNLQSVPNSSKIKEFLEESEYPFEKFAYRYNGNQYRRHRNQGLTTKRYYTSEEGLQDAKRRILPAPSNNGFKAKIKKRIDGFWLCRLVNQMGDYEKHVIVQVETDEDVSRKRTTYLRPNMNIAYTADGARIGPALSASDAVDEWDFELSEVMAQVI